MLAGTLAVECAAAAAGPFRQQRTRSRRPRCAPSQQLGDERVALAAGRHALHASRPTAAAGVRNIRVSAAAVAPDAPSASSNSKYERELEVAVRAVKLAGELCQKIQAGIMLKEEEGLDTKKDRSLVTTADYAAQAIISWTLQQAFPDIPLIAEEDTDSLLGTPEGEAMARRVQEAVNDALASASLPPLTLDQVLSAISRGSAAPSAPTRRHWVLDPVDGTLGFVRGDQYAVALALVDDGRVAVGVLGCPNMPVHGELLETADSYTYGYSPRLVSKLLAGVQGSAGGAWIKGVLFKATLGGGAFAEPSAMGVKGVAPQRVRASEATTWERARFCEPVLKANSSQGFTASVAKNVGIQSKPLRIYSQVKYGSVARGDAEVFMKFPKAGYKEKVWDHAAGVLMVQEAGGVVTDAGGAPLNLGAGRFIEGLDRGIVAAPAQLHAQLLAAIQASFSSSGL